MSWASLFDAQLSGRDPTAGWRRALAEATEAQYARPAPPAMVAAFVLQWCLQVPADAAWVAAGRGWGVVDPAAGGLSFSLAPGYPYPVRARLRLPTTANSTPSDVVDDGAGPTDLERSHAAYLDAGRRFAEAYEPGVRLGPYQRRAMVDDVWAMAEGEALGQRPPPRASCCFIYVLPGVHECAGCPRLRP